MHMLAPIFPQEKSVEQKLIWCGLIFTFKLIIYKFKKKSVKKYKVAY